MQCPQCRAEIEAGQSFCVKCGARVQQPAAPGVPAQPATPPQATPPRPTMPPLPPMPRVPTVSGPPPPPVTVQAPTAPPAPGVAPVVPPTRPTPPQPTAAGARCWRCGAEVPAGAQFCVACGATAQKIEAPAAERPHVVPRVEYPSRKQLRPRRLWLWVTIPSVLIVGAATYVLLTTSYFARGALRDAWAALGKANTVRMTLDVGNLAALSEGQVAPGFSFSFKAVSVWQKPDKFWAGLEGEGVTQGVNVQQMGSGGKAWMCFVDQNVCWETPGMPMPGGPAEVLDSTDMPKMGDASLWVKTGRRQVNGQGCYLLRSDTDKSYAVVYVPSGRKTFLRVEQYAKPKATLIGSFHIELEPPLDPKVVVFAPPANAKVVDQAEGMKMLMEQFMGSMGNLGGAAGGSMPDNLPPALPGAGP